MKCPSCGTNNPQYTCSCQFPKDANGKKVCPSCKEKPVEFDKEAWVNNILKHGKSTS